MVDGAHYLARPAVDFVAERGNELADPGLVVGGMIDLIFLILAFAFVVVATLAALATTSAGAAWHRLIRRTTKAERSEATSKGLQRTRPRQKRFQT